MSNIELEVDAGATVEDCAYEIGTGLGSDTVAGKLDGDLVTKEERVYDGAGLEIVTGGSEEYFEVMRHSAAPLSRPGRRMPLRQRRPCDRTAD